MVVSTELHAAITESLGPSMVRWKLRAIPMGQNLVLMVSSRTVLHWSIWRGETELIYYSPIEGGLLRYDVLKFLAWNRLSPDELQESTRETELEALANSSSPLEKAIRFDAKLLVAAGEDILAGEREWVQEYRLTREQLLGEFAQSIQEDIDHARRLYSRLSREESESPV